MLSVNVDGAKLPPLVVFKQNTLLKEKLPTGIELRVNEEEWFDANLTQGSIEAVWGKGPGVQCKQ